LGRQSQPRDVLREGMRALSEALIETEAHAARRND
jgi:hypothetical protein